jgi:glycosyl transferase family 2/glycosyl transferase family 1
MNAVALPATSRGTLQAFAAFRDAHRGSNMVVCGCGESLTLLQQPDRFLTIGVNDVGRHFTPDYLVVVNPRSQFSTERFRHIETSQAKALFTQLPDLPVPHPNVVRFRLGAYGGTDLSGRDVLHYTQNSPYVAVCLALHMGAQRIGLIGVDFTDRHFFGRTGPHALGNRLDQIDREYGRLAAACRVQGVELANLSPHSRLSALPRMPLESFSGAAPAALKAIQPARRRVFFVTYRFLSCGDVFTEGLRHAAEDLGIECADAAWDDPYLPTKVERFGPDLLFVVHGRNFSRRWGRKFAGHRTAVWLLDEPYEVDDSRAYVSGFDHVFVNDSATLDRHRNAHYLPVCYDPRVHFAAEGQRRYDVGFVGGANATRERMLVALAQRGLLSYLVGGVWRSGLLNRRCLAVKMPAAQTAALYRETKIVVNVFRDVHHFNRGQIPGASLNPRIYEALACGALVISEERAELTSAVPELPTFSDERRLIALVEQFLGNPTQRESVRAACAERLREGTYRERLRSVMSLTSEKLDPASEPSLRPNAALPEVGSAAPILSVRPDRPAPAVVGEGWQECGPVEIRDANGTLLLQRSGDWSPGSERGISSRTAYEGLSLAFEVFISPGTCFIAKINQEDAFDQTTNSYHLYCDDRSAYLARHDHVFGHVTVARRTWEPFRVTYGDGVLCLYKGDRLLHRIADETLTRGYAFLGVKGGAVRLRNVRLMAPPDGDRRPAERGPIAPRLVSGPDATAIHAPDREVRPRVSIITTVYDRTDCLRRCIRSVKALRYRDYEHIIVSDGPDPAVVQDIAGFVRQQDDERLSYFDLTRRFNNWGIAPADAGLKRARGEFVCFLSDDNGYLPEHLNILVSALDRDPRVGFAYASCLYGGRFVLRSAAPGPGRIDLGQPLFRRELFDRHFGGGLPFDVMAWDWALIEALLKLGVRWKHIDKASFVFRLASYPRLVASLP